MKKKTNSDVRKMLEKSDPLFGVECIPSDYSKRQYSNYTIANDLVAVPILENFHKFLGIEEQPRVDLPPRHDHDFLFFKNGEPYSYVMQPYYLTEKGSGLLADYCKKYNLIMRVTRNGWHNEKVIMIELKKHTYKK